MAFCYIRVEHYFFCKSGLQGSETNKVSPWPLGWWIVAACLIHEGFTRWGDVIHCSEKKHLQSFSHFEQLFTPSCDITALTSDSEGVGQGDGAGGADSAGVVSSVRSSHKPQHQSVSLTGLLKRDPKKLICNVVLKSSCIANRKTDQLLHNMLISVSN